MSLFNIERFTTIVRSRPLIIIQKQINYSKPFSSFLTIKWVINYLFINNHNNNLIIYPKDLFPRKKEFLGKEKNFFREMAVGTIK